MIKDYFYRVTLELDDSDPDERLALAFDFPDGDVAARFAEMAYKACDIINADIKIVHNEVDTTNSPMWRKICYKDLLNSEYGYVDTDSVKEVSNGKNSTSDL